MDLQHGFSGDGGRRRTARAPEAAASRSPPCILVVDDDPDLLEMLTRILRGGDRVVICARDFDAARARLDEHPVSLLLTDLQLGDGRKNEGLDLAAFVQAHRPGTKTLLLSAGLTARTRRKAAQHGVGVVMEKPFDVDALQAAVRRLLAT